MIEKTTRKEREREKTEKIKKDMDKLAYPLTPDRTAIETHYNRSRKIRWRIYNAMIEYSKDNRSFADSADLANNIGNSAKCAYETAKRWINQYTALNGDFYFFDDEHRIQYKKVVNP